MLADPCAVATMSNLGACVLGFQPIMWPNYFLFDVPGWSSYKTTSISGGDCEESSVIGAGCETTSIYSSIMGVDYGISTPYS